ncbi:hypothetical protein HK098_001588 [Nowakowskiella sp. JEL0407]|nr:hypothetical protein HK098_001588 [Nowakowskiella sp. JEL0407]
MSDSNIQNLKVAELKAELLKLGLPTNGLKKDLVARLQTAHGTSPDQNSNDTAPSPSSPTKRRGRASSTLKSPSKIKNSESEAETTSHSSEKVISATENTGSEAAENPPTVPTSELPENSETAASVQTPSNEVENDQTSIQNDGNNVLHAENLPKDLPENNEIAESVPTLSNETENDQTTFQSDGIIAEILPADTQLNERNEQSKPTLIQCENAQTDEMSVNQESASSTVKETARLNESQADSVDEERNSDALLRKRNLNEEEQDISSKRLKGEDVESDFENNGATSAEQETITAAQIESDLIPETNKSEEIVNLVTSARESKLSTFSSVSSVLTPLLGKSTHTHSVPPPTCDPTDTIIVRNFVRPLKLPDVRTLLEKYGELKFFWMDKIKTHCYAAYSTIQEASHAREDIFGIVFPDTSFGRALQTDFITEENAQKQIAENEAKQSGQSRNEARSPPLRKPYTPSIPVPEVQKDKVRGISLQALRDGADLSGFRSGNLFVDTVKKEEMETQIRLRIESDREKFKNATAKYSKTKTFPYVYWKPVSKDDQANEKTV